MVDQAGIVSNAAGGVLCVAILGFDSSRAIFYETLRRIVRTTCVNKRWMLRRPRREATMDYELSLTEDQQRRIEQVQTPKEKLRIIDEAFGVSRDGVELSEDELDAMSGGGWNAPATMEEAKDALSMVQFLYTNFGPEYANLWLEERGYPRVKHEAFRSGAGISQLRRFWLSRIEGTGEWVNDGSLWY